MMGFQRALFSNEAGLGSASIAHAAVKTRHPVTEGLVATVGPFLDTIVICTLTSLCIITTMLAVDDFVGQVSSDGTNLAVGIELTSATPVVGSFSCSDERLNQLYQLLQEGLHVATIGPEAPTFDAITQVGEVAAQ